MNTDNIHYLVSKVRTLEEENKELEGLNDSLLSRNKELVKRSKEAEKELEFIDYLDKTIVESKLEKNDLSNNAAVIYQKELVKAEKHIKELEEKLKSEQVFRKGEKKENHRQYLLLRERIKELESLEVFHTDEEAPDCPARFTLNNVVYFEDSRGCFMMADDEYNNTVAMKITHQEYVDSLNQYLKQEDPRDYPEEPSIH